MATASKPMGAPFADRFAAKLVDGVILIIPSLMLHFSTIPFLGPLTLSFLYYVFFECSPAQATPGKRLAGILVVSHRGGGISLLSATLRMIFRTISTSLCFLPYLAMFFTRQRQTAHDLLTDTYVIVGKNDEPLIESWLESFKEFISLIQKRLRKTNE